MKIIINPDKEIVAAVKAALADNKGSDVRSFEEADEKTFYEMLADNLSQYMRVILKLVNERRDVNIEIEFNIRLFKMFMAISTIYESDQ